LQDLEVNACPVLPPDDIQLSPEIIHRLPDALRSAQSIFESTGGLHAAARFALRGNLECLEKDFKCLHRSVEQEPDAYPHPLMS
jgi:FdhD protein